MLSLLNYTKMETKPKYAHLFFGLPSAQNKPAGDMGVFNMDKLCDFFEGREVSEW